MVKKTAYLSSRERERGTAFFLKHAVYNGMGFTLMADTTIALMAINLGATNTELGYLGSAIHISGLILPFVPVLFGGVNIARLFYITWLIRGLVCGFYFLVPFVGRERGMTIILTVYTLFCLTRAIGASMAGPIQRGLTTATATGDLVARLSVRFNMSALAGRILSAAVMKVRFLAGLPGLLTLELSGMIVNTVSALYLRKIPCRDKVERTAVRSIVGVFTEYVFRRDTALPLLLTWATLCIGIMYAFTIPFLSRAAGFSDSLVFVYTLTATAASVVTAFFIKPFVDRMGSKPLLVVSNTLVVLLSLAWAMAPVSTPAAGFFALGFLTVLATTLSGLLINRLVILTMPEQDKVNYTAMYSFFGAIIALAAGYGGGLLTDLGAAAAVPYLHQFSFPYFCAAGIALGSLLLTGALRDSGSLSLREAAGILLSVRNLRDFLDLYQLDTTKDPVRRETVLAAIEQSSSALATAEIGNRLRSPLAAERERALKSLFTNPRPELLDDVIDDAQDRHSYTRATAIFALGAYPGERTVELLRRLLDETDRVIQSSAAKSLARIGDVSVLTTVAGRSADPSLSTLCRINYAIALTIMDKSGAHLRGIFSLADPAMGQRSQQSVLSTIARFLGLEPALSEFFHAENLESGSGIESLLDEARELSPFLDFEHRAETAFASQRYREIWEWCGLRIEE